MEISSIGKSTREKKKVEQEQIQSNIDRLRILFEYVRKTDNADRYIVGSDTSGWGVVSGNGDIILPLLYTNITMSGKKLFRAYTKEYGMSGLGFMLKEQGLYDINGKEIIPPSQYDKVLSVGAKGYQGLIYGNTFESILPIRLVLYNGANITFRGKIVSVSIMDNIPCILLIRSHIGDNQDIFNALRLDKIASNELEITDENINQCKDIWDTLEDIKDTDIDEEITQLGIDNTIIKYKGTINGVSYYCDGNYIPLNYIVGLGATHGKKRKYSGKIKTLNGNNI